MFRLIVISVLLLFLPLTASAYHKNLIKGRIGYFDVKKSTGKLSNGVAPRQKVSSGLVGEVALARFFTSNLAIEVGIGSSFINTQGGADTKKKKSLLIPLNGLAQFHLPVGNMFTPYVGVGYQYQIAQQTKGLKINQAGGLLYQAGIDLFIFDLGGLNLDCKYSEVKHNLGSSGAKFKSKFKTISTMIGVTIPF
jgi:outer membrane protein W